MLFTGVSNLYGKFSELGLQHGLLLVARVDLRRLAWRAFNLRTNTIH